VTAISQRDTSPSAGRGAGRSAAASPAATGKLESFSVDTIDGGRFTSPAGKPAVVFFISSQGCDSCAAEATELDAAASGYGDRIAVVGVEMVPGTPAAALRDFRATVGVHYPLAADPGGGLVHRFGVDAVATAVVLDPQGRVVFSGVAPDTTALRDALTTAGVA
jgi:peroxiredoxin